MPNAYITGSGQDLQLILWTHRTLSLKFGCSLLLRSGIAASQSSFSDKGIIGKTDVFLDDVPCFFSERDIFCTPEKPHDPSAAGSLFVTVADSSASGYHRMLTRVSVSNIGR